MSVYGEVARLAAAFPSPKWDMERTQVFVDALEGLHDDDVRQGVDEILRAWRERFPPSPGQVREVCEVYRRLRSDQQRALIEREREREQIEGTAPAWHGRLWIAVFLATAKRRGREVDPGPKIAPYVEIAESLGMTWDRSFGEQTRRTALEMAEEVFVASGEKDTQELREREARGFVNGVWTGGTRRV